MKCQTVGGFLSKTSSTRVVLSFFEKYLQPLARSLCLIILILCACAKGPEDPETRANRLGSQLRCPVCRGVPIAESPATLATEMMGIVHEQIQAGKSDEEILKYFEERYGEWVLLKPKPEGMNLVVWILPVLVFLGGGIFIFVAAKRRRSS